MFHAMGVGLSLQALYNGAAVAVYSLPEPRALVELIRRNRPTILPLVPTAIRMLLDDPHAATADFSSVRTIVYAGSSIGLDLLKRAMAAFRCDFIQFYGSTETCAGILFLRPDQHRSADENILASCGSPLPLIGVKIADAEGRELPDGSVGELLIRSPSITTGYFNQPVMTAAAFHDGWYRSGDAGYRDPDGLLHIVDRVKDMIVTGGENVYSTEVENAVHTLPGVQLCAVVGLPDATWGERVVAVVVCQPETEMTENLVISHCRNLIARYKVPKEVKFVSELPMTPSNKVMKRVLREQFTVDVR